MPSKPLNLTGTVREHRIWPEKQKATKIRTEKRTKEQLREKQQAYYWSHREKIAERRKTAYATRRKRA